MARSISCEVGGIVVIEVPGDARRAEIEPVHGLGLAHPARSARRGVRRRCAAVSSARRLRSTARGDAGDRGEVGFKFGGRAVVGHGAVRAGARSDRRRHRIVQPANDGVDHPLARCHGPARGIDRAWRQRPGACSWVKASTAARTGITASASPCIRCVRTEAWATRGGRANRPDSATTRAPAGCPSCVDSSAMIAPCEKPISVVARRPDGASLVATARTACTKAGIAAATRAGRLVSVTPWTENHCQPGPRPRALAR